MADVDVPYGSIILREDPYCFALFNDKLSAHCCYCMRSGGDCELKKCSRCGYFWYCSRDCQKNDWSGHKLECKIFASGKELPETIVRFMLRMIKKSEQEKGKPQKDGERTFKDLMTHEEKIRQDKKSMDEFMALLSQLVRFTEGHYKLPKPKEVLTVYCKNLINWFQIYMPSSTSDTTVAGIGLYINGCRYDHNCKPNAIWFFEGRKMVIKALRDIKKGEEIFVTYLELMTHKESRKEELLTNYYFDCNCNACVNPSFEEKLFPARCHNNGCEGVVFVRDGKFTTCKICSSSRPSEDVAKYKDHLEKSKKELEKLNLQHRMAYIGDTWPTVLSQAWKLFEYQLEMFPVRNFYVASTLSICAALSAIAPSKSLITATDFPLASCAREVLSAFFDELPSNTILGELALSCGYCATFQRNKSDAIFFFKYAMDHFALVNGEDARRTEVIRKLYLTACKDM